VRPRPEAGLVLLDACCLINLYATGRIDEILEALPDRFATSHYVATREVLSFAAAPARNLEILEIATDGELADLIRFAAALDDGEASICALAAHRQARVATDDRKTLRLLGRHDPPVPTLQTPELLFAWAELAKPPRPELVAALTAVETRARFIPRRDAPCFGWWSALTVR
jgi:hypothetical protein